MARSRLAEQIAQVAAALDRIGARTALIGGLALASHNVVRATQDVDLLADADRADDIEAQLTALGYTCAHRSDDAATYLRRDERIDLLYARRPIARKLLAEARETHSALGPLRVVSAEGLSHLSGQVVRRHPSQAAGDPYEALDDLMVVVEALCPVWPIRGPLREGSRMLL